jgi:hypothetical protein
MMTRLRPKDPTGYLLRGLAFEGLRKKEAARNEFLKVLALKPGPGPRFYAERGLYQLGYRAQPPTPLRRPVTSKVKTSLRGVSPTTVQYGPPR